MVFYNGGGKSYEIQRYFRYFQPQAYQLADRGHSLYSIVRPPVDHPFFDGRTYETYATIHELKSMLGSGFIRADRATLVSIKGIHDIGKEIELVNGETLYYSCRKKRELKEQLRAGRRQIAQSLSDSDAPTTQEEYQRHYASYDSAPFAFTDIEMVFNEERAAVDWIFRYGNEALAEIEKRRCSSSSTTLSAAFSPIWTQSGCASTSAQRCSVKRWNCILQPGD